MKPIDFPGTNCVFGASQLEYQPLPAIKIKDVEGTVITCWQLTDEEINCIKETKCFYLKQLTFNAPYHPLLPMIELGDDTCLSE